MSLDLKSALVHYFTLRNRVSEMFSSVEKKYASEFACRAGCHSCCKPGLTVSAIEAAAIEEYLQENGAEFQAFGRERCAFLDKAGRCTIYEARPIVCRSHGAPLQFKAEDGEMLLRDVCSLNFKEKDLAEIPAADVLNLETLNTLLATLNIQAFGKKKSGVRVGLTPEEIRNQMPPGHRTT